MKIYKEGDELVVRLPLSQSVNNSYFFEDEDPGKTDNLIGVVAGDEYTISQLNDLSYKGDQQEGPPLIHFYGDKEEFIKLCDSLGLAVWEHELCVKCSQPVYGSCTWDHGPVCWGCEHNEEETKTSEAAQELAEDLAKENQAEQGDSE